MAKKPKVVTSFCNYKQTEFLAKANTILTGMSGNTNFPNPFPDLNTISIAANNYNAALTQEPGRQTTSFIKQTRAALTVLLNQLAMYVQAHGNDNASILLSSGYSLAKTPERRGILEKPENFSATAKSKNTIKLKINRINNAQCYCFEYTPMPVNSNSVWQTVISSKSKTNIMGLTSGKEYAFRVAAVGNQNMHVYSDVISSYVL